MKNKLNEITRCRRQFQQRGYPKLGSHKLQSMDKFWLKEFKLRIVFIILKGSRKKISKALQDPQF